MTNQEKFIALVNNDIIKKSDAIVLLEGDGLNRCQRAIELYRADFADKIVFSGVADNPSYGSFPLSKMQPIFDSSSIPATDIIHENISTNTMEQANEVIKMAINNNWRRIILVASPYHQYRAYLTFLRSILDSNSSIILYNAPAKNLPWFTDAGWGRRFDLLDQEFKKIKKYSALSHLATLEEVIKYQKWKEQQA